MLIGALLWWLNFEHNMLSTLLVKFFENFISETASECNQFGLPLDHVYWAIYERPESRWKIIN